jgi:hypothetical protein
MIEMFQAHGLTLVPTEMTASDYFCELLPAMTSGIVRILDSERLHSQFMQLERCTSSSGKDNIGHPTSGNFHDDLAVAVAISLVGAKAKRGPMVITDPMLREAARPTDWRHSAPSPRDLFGPSNRPNAPLCWGGVIGRTVPKV